MSRDSLDPLQLFRLDGDVAVVTGASSGLGVRFARVLHAAGAQVVLAARRLDRLERLSAELPGSLVVQADVSLADDRERLIDAAIGFGGGRLDILVNNAGIGQKVAIEDEDVETFRMAMEVNVTAVWHLSKLAAVPMGQHGYGTIINLASILGYVGSTPITQSHYCASKGAVLNLSRELGLQWARKGIRVNSICPGWFPSELTAGMETEEGGAGFIRRNTPMQRMGEEHELDGALMLLASRASTYMTGQSIIVDGGWLAR
jgi:NAD(P)-dependent dehydrogenase (short-subunit alcohol dehydrogenase family)